MENKYANYLKKCDYYVLLQKQYADKFAELDTEMKKNAFRKEYASGGEVIHRGWYCPSPIYDIVIGGCNRGRLLKKPPDMKKNRYEYIFDITGKLICVDIYTYWDDIKENLLYNREFIINSTNYSFSIGFDTNTKLDIPPNINIISECIYDENGQIIEYYYALCNLYYGGKGCSEINVELFEYKNDLLISSVMQFCNFVNSLPELFKNDINSFSSDIKESFSRGYILHMDKYFFNYGNDGFIDSYTIRGYMGEIEEPWDGHIYEVSKYKKKTVKIDHKAEILKKFMPVIQSWSVEDIYAISFYVEGDDPAKVILGYNTESYYKDNKSLASSSLEARWNFAFWLQNEEFEYVGIGLTTKSFVKILVDVVKELHSSGFIKETFKKDIPIIIHELEYYNEIKNQNIKANGLTSIREFLEFINN